MPIKPLLNPDNAIESALGFKEGLVRVEQSVYKVHQPKSGEGQKIDRNPFLALAWQVTRLDEESKEPLVDEDGNPVTEEVIFSFGATSLAKAHPGMADSATAESIEDLGVEINTEGPIIFLKDSGWWPNNKAGITHMMASMKAKGTKKEQLDRVWAPDWVGSILYLKSVQAADKMWRPNKAGVLEEQTYSYKVVERIEKGPRAVAAVEKPKVVAKPSKANGPVKAVSADPEVQIKPLIEQISQQKAGTSISKKTMIAHLITVINEHGLGKQTPSLVGLVQDDQWLEANGTKYDFVFDAQTNTIAFS